MDTSIDLQLSHLLHRYQAVFIHLYSHQQWKHLRLLPRRVNHHLCSNSITEVLDAQADSFPFPQT